MSSAAWTPDRNRPIEIAPAIAGLLAGQRFTNVEVDGGIQEQAIAMAVNAGANIAPAGSAVFDPACVTTLHDAAAGTVTSRTTTARGVNHP